MKKIFTSFSGFLIHSMFTSYVLLCSVAQNQALDLSIPPSGVLLGNIIWPGAGSVTEIASNVIVAPGAVLSIEAGAVLRFTTASAALTVRGTLRANGRADARIVFDGVNQITGGLAALQIPALSSTIVNVSYASFINFGQAVWRSSGGTSNLVLFESCIFERNGAAAVASGYNFWSEMIFRRCEFSHNSGPVTGSNFNFDGCYFHNQESSVIVEYSSFSNCVFLNHTGTAAMISWGGTVRDSLFVRNDVAIQGEGRGPTVLNCILILNRVGIIAANDASITGGWICSRPSDNSSSLIVGTMAVGMIPASDVWFGVSGQDLAIIRGSIIDIYWFSTSALVDLVRLADHPTEWPVSLRPMHTSYAPLCAAPQNQALDLSNPPSGVLLGNIIWPGAGSVTEIASNVIVAPGAVLSIEAGAVLRFTTASAALTVRGTLRANGRADARIVFDGVNQITGGLAALQIPALSSTIVNVSYASFINFGQAVWRSSGGTSNLVLFESCIFERNGAAAVASGYNFWSEMIFRRCEFSHNSGPVTGSNFNFDGCYFHNQESSVIVEYSSFSNCVFLNHTGTAAMISWGGTVRDSLFVRNDVAIQGEGRGPTVLNCILILNRVGIIAANDASITGGWICSRPSDNSSSLIVGTMAVGMIPASDVWFGVSGQDLAIIRGSIIDIYWFSTSALVDLVRLADHPTEWPVSLRPMHTSYAPLCAAPQNQALDLSNPPSGVLLGNIIRPHQSSATLTAFTTPPVSSTLLSSPSSLLRTTIYEGKLSFPPVAFLS
jgi:hypothetical protein